MYNKYAYSKYEGEAKVALDKFASDYIDFLSRSKTERVFTKNATELAVTKSIQLIEVKILLFLLLEKRILKKVLIF